jgi:predicted RND superfamily exporter protein
MDHDFYWGFSHFWWLIFPLFWMVMSLAWGWSRHSRANRALDIIKSYADQGKEPPPELLKALQQNPDGGWCGPGRSWRRTPQERLSRAFLFAALSCAFGFMAFWPQFSGAPYHHNPFGLVFLTVIFAAFAVSNILSVIFQAHDPHDKDGKNQ